jgi:type III restriction enzyme
MAFPLHEGMVFTIEPILAEGSRRLIHWPDGWTAATFDGGYSAQIEHEVLKVAPPANVTVYGKLPRRSIKLPTYTGGTTSPDFVYAIKKDEQAITLHLVVETKSDNMRMSDEIAVKSQKEAFKNIQNIEWRMSTKVEDFVRDLKELTEN